MAYSESIEKALASKGPVTYLNLRGEVLGQVPNVVFEFRDLENLHLSALPEPGYPAADRTTGKAVAARE